MSEVNQMNRRNWKPFVIAGAAIVVIAVVATILLVQEQSLRGKIVKLEGNTVTLATEGGQTQVVKLSNVEGLTVGTTVEIEGYSPETMTGERAQVIQP
jgi:RNase P/RNase MRP subunit p29